MRRQDSDSYSQGGEIKRAFVNVNLHYYICFLGLKAIRVKLSLRITKKQQAKSYACCFFFF